MEDKINDLFVGLANIEEGDARMLLLDRIKVLLVGFVSSPIKKEEVFDKLTYFLDDDVIEGMSSEDESEDDLPPKPEATEEEQPKASEPTFDDSNHDASKSQEAHPDDAMSGLLFEKSSPEKLDPIKVEDLLPELDDIDIGELTATEDSFGSDNDDTDVMLSEDEAKN